MSTRIRELAKWATSLTLSEARPGTLQRVRLQHLHMAAACRESADARIARVLRAAGSKRGAARLIGGKSASRRDAVRLHVGLATWLNQTDHLFWGSSGPGAVPSAWAMSKDKTTGDLLRATLAANEIGGRLGASIFLGPQGSGASAAITALSSAVSCGLLEGLDTEQLAHAMALALTNAGSMAPHVLRSGADGRALLQAVPAVRGLEAVAMAKAGMTGPLGLLDGPDGLLEELCWTPLPNAFSGLGSAWLSDSLAFSFCPAHRSAEVAVEAVGEILARHMKAAGRRLRPDQVDRVEVHTSFPAVLAEAAGLPRGTIDSAGVIGSMRVAIATLLVGHELGFEQLQQDWLSREHERIRDLASRVEVTHSWELSVQQVTHMAESVAPLFAGLTVSELRELAKRALGREELLGPGMGIKERWSLLRARPDRLLEKIRYTSGDLSDVDWSDWQPRIPTEVRLYTTRGGSWPEKRSLPEGAPGASWDATVARVVDRFAGQDEGLKDSAIQALDSDPSAPAEDWVNVLLQ